MSINKKETELPAPYIAGAGYEGIDRTDLIIPRIKIVQPTSQNGTPGKFISNLTGEEYDELKVVFLKATKGRVYWESLDLEADPICRSSDGYSPDPNLEEPVDSICGKREGNRFVPVCPKALWTEDPPECKGTYNLLAIDQSSGMPFWISLHGLQISPTKRFISGMILKKRNLFDARVTLRLTEVKAPKGKCFVISFEDIEELSDKEKESYRKLYEELNMADIEVTFEAEKMDKES